MGRDEDKGRKREAHANSYNVILLDEHSPALLLAKFRSLPET